MKLYSDAFLNDSYLKYVGWTMHDKVSLWKKLVMEEDIKAHILNLRFLRVSVCSSTRGDTVSIIEISINIINNNF